MIAIPLLFGQALALVAGESFNWQWFALIHVFGLLCQIYILYLNDYADEALDRINQSYWLSGGSRVIPEGHLTGQQLYAASFIALGGLLVLSAVGYTLGRGWMPALTGLALVLGWSYSLAPIKASYRGYGELHQAFSCAVFLPVMGFYLQVGSLVAFPWALLLPLVLIFFAANIITALADATSDKLGGKQTYPVRHGDARAR
ncbi:MAG: prenyltransferase, partial [Nevskiales bacterium]